MNSGESNSAQTEKGLTLDQGRVAFSERSRFSKALWGAGLGVIFGAAALFAAYLTMDVFSGTSAEASSRTLAGLLIGGLLTFLFGLAAVVAVFSSLNLDRNDHPLGLPDGSVQAFIALFLILLFFIMSVFIYINVSNTSSDRTLRDLTEQARDELLSDPSTQVVAVVPRQVEGNVVDGETALETRFDVVVAAPLQRSDVADDIARQLVTTIGTLIVAIAAFYFGAKTVQETREPSDDMFVGAPPGGSPTAQEDLSPVETEIDRRGDNADVET